MKKKNFFNYKSVLFIICLALLNSCQKKEKINVSGITPKKPLAQPLGKIVSPSYVFANYVTIVNNNVYEDLLSVCRRCGKKRIIEGPFGTTYQRFYSLGENIKACKNWLYEAFLQIEFETKQLPTSVKVLIQPKYKGSRIFWGEAFELKALASPINENEGFEIIISPKDGLNGNYNLIVRSTYTNHVKNSNLNIHVMYGGQNFGYESQGFVMIDASLRQYAKRWVETPNYTCQQYTN
ncbi:MAG: hypothetical protein GDA46_01965 [Bdellovibrionales bacterium]|nr:hypothetical protein [Bdellovibrionales bacterium]